MPPGEAGEPRNTNTRGTTRRAFPIGKWLAMSCFRPLRSRQISTEWSPELPQRAPTVGGSAAAASEERGWPEARG